MEKNLLINHNYMSPPEMDMPSDSNESLNALQIEEFKNKIKTSFQQYMGMPYDGAQLFSKEEHKASKNTFSREDYINRYAKFYLFWIHEKNDINSPHCNLNKTFIVNKGKHVVTQQIKRLDRDMQNDIFKKVNDMLA